MSYYSHQLKTYTKEDLEGKELVKINSFLWDGKVLVDSIKVTKITDKTVMLYGGGRIPISEVGLNKTFGRLICPKEDLEEIVAKYKEVMTGMYREEISKLEQKIEELQSAKIKYAEVK
jgi:hypothetical protein